MNSRIFLALIATSLIVGAQNSSAIVHDASISGGPPSSKITLFGADDAQAANEGGASIKPKQGHKKTPKEKTGTVVQTDDSGQFHFSCIDGQRYRIDRNDGKEFDSFICRDGGLVCLADANAVTRPYIYDIPKGNQAGEEVKDTASGFAKSMMGMGGGGFGMGSSGFGMAGRGGGRHSGASMIKKPRGSWQRFSSGDTGIEMLGWVYNPHSKRKNPEIRIGVRVKDSPDQGAPHQMILQHQSGRLLMPIGYMVFEIWVHWKLTITITRESYVDGELVSRSVTRSSYSWKELMERYSAIFTLPAIWEQLGGDNPKAFGKFRGILAQFPLPENFNPAEWSLVTHITSKARANEIPSSIWNIATDRRKNPVRDNTEVLLTVPFISNLSFNPKKKKDLFFTAPADHRTFYQQSHGCPFQPLRLPAPG